jgi:hypothetical protein
VKYGPAGAEFSVDPYFTHVFHAMFAGFGSLGAIFYSKKAKNGVLRVNFGAVAAGTPSYLIVNCIEVDFFRVTGAPAPTSSINFAVVDIKPARAGSSCLSCRNRCLYWTAESDISSLIPCQGPKNLIERAR